MKVKALYILIAFLAIFAIHFAYAGWVATHTSSLWVQPDDAGWPSNYFLSEDYMLGISYALAVAFTVYAFQRLAGNREGGVVGMLSGFTLTGILYFGACFLTGCCGSPMLAVYLSILGPSYLGFTKPIILAFTILSITASYFWMEHKAKKPCCCAGGVCNSK